MQQTCGVVGPICICFHEGLVQARSCWQLLRQTGDSLALGGPLLSL